MAQFIQFANKIAGFLNPRPAQEKITADDMNEIKAVVNFNGTQLDSVAGDTSSLGGRVTTTEGDISSLGGRVTTTEGDISSLGGRVTTVEGNVATALDGYYAVAIVNANGTIAKGRNVTSVSKSLTGLYDVSFPNHSAGNFAYSITVEGFDFGVGTAYDGPGGATVRILNSSGNAIDQKFYIFVSKI
jgi:hypothetical protein